MKGHTLLSVFANYHRRLFMLIYFSVLYLPGLIEEVDPKVAFLLINLASVFCGNGEDKPGR